MAKRPEVALFCEDAGHESFARALVQRLAEEVGVPRPAINAISARGGHGRAIAELKKWQRFARSSSGVPDLLLVLIDANGEGHVAQTKAIEDAVDAAQFPAVTIACPDPHVEAWCAADPVALQALLGQPPPPLPSKSGRGTYKNWLRAALDQADIPYLSDPMDIAYDLVPAINLFHAAKSCPSLKVLIDGLRAHLQPFALKP